MRLDEEVVSWGWAQGCGCEGAGAWGEGGGCVLGVEGVSDDGAEPAW